MRREQKIKKKIDFRLPPLHFLKENRNRDASPPFRKFVKSPGAHRSAHTSVPRAVTGQRHVLFHLIGGR